MVDRNLNINIERVLQDKEASAGQDLIATTANIIGTAYKGSAFVPKKIVLPDAIAETESGEDAEFIYNTYTNVMGTSRQNRHEHLYDDYSCNINSDGYDAISIWMENGGEQATFTRVLGAGTGIKDQNTKKMIGSGFNAENNISSGTLTHTVSRNLNAIDNGVEGNVSFIFKTINEIDIRSDDANNADVNSVDYLGEIFSGIKTKEQTPDINILSDVIIFASGVLPSLTSDNLSDTNSHFNYASSASAYGSQTKQTVNKKQNFISLQGFKPQNEPDIHKPFSYVQDTFLDTTNYIKKQHKYSNSDKNYFSSRFLERGHVAYTTFPYNGINDSVKEHSRFTVLTSKKYSEVIDGLVGDDANIPDYNSFESEYTTAKTPWITSQPVQRSGLTDNRTTIHNNVQRLFRFWSLSDGDVGNKYRIKINPTRRGEPQIESNFKSDDEFSTFDIFIFVYDARDNSYSLLETYKDVNLNPDSPKYIASLIGDLHEYYDFDLKKSVKKGFFVNKSQHLRVEMHKDIENKSFKNQHSLIPSGFESYPYIHFEKNSFKNFINNPENLNSLFDTQGVYQLPPLYALNKYSEYNTNHLVDNIRNHWGVVFNRSKIKNKLLQPNDLVSYNNPVTDEVSPHFYYTKYFLSGIEGSHSYKNVWREDNKNYLNSFFHLEKILVKTNDDDTKQLDRYKHSGRVPSDATNYSYLNLSDDNIWLPNRTLKNAYRDQLSFDFFTYGGFDGTDIRDNDKRFFRNDAIIRELYDSNETSSTLESYKIAIDVATDNTDCAGDILVVPGIKEIPIVEKCIQKCEEDRRHFYLVDISGAASNRSIENYTDSRTGKGDIKISSKGVMGQNFIIEDILENYFINKSSITAEDKRFILTGENDPNLGDNLSYYNYKSVLEKNFSFVKESWVAEDLKSRYLFASYGDLVATLPDDSEKQVSSEVFVLGKFAQLDSPISDILGESTLSFHGAASEFSLILQNRLSYRSETFESELSDFRKSSANLLYVPNNESVQLLTQLTSYEIRKSVFHEQKHVRTIQEIKKRVKYNLFIDDTLISGGALFSQNSMFNNLYQKINIQLNSLLQEMVEEGLITDFNIRIQNSQDPKTTLDMQNYIIRGNIVLQFGESDIINLQLDEALSELSLLANPGQDSVYIPKI